MAAAKTLVQMQEFQKHIYLFDTFCGMTHPGEVDIDSGGRSAKEQFCDLRRGDGPSDLWCRAPLNEVKSNMLSVGYHTGKIHFVEGPVEDTIPNQAPDRISLLRLDTDWYQSTRHELVHLYPRLSVGGIIIIDDYGYWQGCRLAVDEYIEKNKLKLFLTRIDGTARLGVKLHD